MLKHRYATDMRKLTALPRPPSWIKGKGARDVKKGKKEHHMFTQCRMCAEITQPTETMDRDMMFVTCRVVWVSVSDQARKSRYWENLQTRPTGHQHLSTETTACGAERHWRNYKAEARCVIAVNRPTTRLERCNPWPHVANRHYLHKPAIIIVTSFSLWRHWRVSCLRRSQPPFSLWRHSLLSWPRPSLRTYVGYVRTPYRV